MAFKIPEKRTVRRDDPESLFWDLRKKTVPGLLSHQAELLRSYLAVHTKHSDIALQLPTGGGKTLIGLLICRVVKAQLRRARGLSLSHTSARQSSRRAGDRELRHRRASLPWFEGEL